jgi:hypothetical protein
MTPVIEEPQYEVPRWLRGALRADGRGIFDAQSTVQLYNNRGELFWESNPGPQTWILHCKYNEVLIGGQRGGGKTAGLIAWLAMGDNELAEDDPARVSFLNDPTYRAVIFRQQYQAMSSLIEEMATFFRPFGGKPKGEPVIFEFKSGAKIYTRHLNDTEAYNQIRGWNVTRIAIEEGTQIPDKQSYIKLLGSLRSSARMIGGRQFPKLRTQLMMSANPDGPGADWVCRRFVDVPVSTPDKMALWNVPMQDPLTGLTRIFIPMGLKDNKYLRNDAVYKGMLMSQTEVVRKQWMEGDWHAGLGIYFSDYRPEGPRGEDEKRDYPWADHRPTNPPELKPWWYRWGGGDWGFEHPASFHKFCRNEQDGRIHVYDELVVRHVGSYELGVTLAKWWARDLELLPDHQIVLYLSPDAFSKTDSNKTKAEQLADGIREVYGPFGAFLLKYTPEEAQMGASNPAAAAASFERRRAEIAGSMAIILKPANTDRVAGWSHITELLRFRPVLADLKPKEEDLKRILELRGIEAYESELSKWHGRKPEVLPKLQIWKACRGADRCLRRAMHDDPPRAEDVRKWNADNGLNGDDELDSLRHGLMASKEFATVIPKAYWVQERMGKFQEEYTESFGEPLTDMTRLVMIHQTQEALYKKKHPPAGGSFTLARRGAPERHRMTVQ